MYPAFLVADLPRSSVSVVDLMPLSRFTYAGDIIPTER